MLWIYVDILAEWHGQISREDVEWACIPPRMCPPFFRSLPPSPSKILRFYQLHQRRCLNRWFRRPGITTLGELTLMKFGWCGDISNQNHKSQSKTKSKTNLRNGWNGAKNLWRFQVGSLPNRVFVWVKRISCGRNQGLQEQIPVILHWFTVMGQHTALVQRWGNFSSSFRPLMSLMLMAMVKFLFQSFVWCSQATSCVGRVKDVKMRWLKQTKRKGKGNGWSLAGKIGWN